MKKLNCLLFIFFLVSFGFKTFPAFSQIGDTLSTTGTITLKRIDKGPINDSENIQKAINAIPKEGGTLEIPSGLYIISELIRIDNRQNITISISNDAELLSQKHGHGILEISNSKNITIKGGKFIGAGNFLNKNYKGGIGGGEKLFTASQKVNWGHHRNSEYQKLENYNGGFIGNCGIGILISNGSEDITVLNAEIEKFNYSGIQVQFLGDSTVFQKNYCKNIRIENNIIHDIYSAGISVHGLTESDILNNTIYNIGHPNTNGEELQVNPGYGITMRGVSKEETHANNITVAYNGIRNCKRVGIDSHSGTNLNFHDNTIDRALIAGISIVGKSGKRDAVRLSRNIINNCGNVSGGEGIEAKTAIRNNYSNSIIENNVIKNSGYSFGIYNTGSNTIITENTIFYFLATNNPFTRGICVVGSEENRVTENEILENTIEGDIASSIYIDYLSGGSVMNNFSISNNSDDAFKFINSKLKKRRNKSRK